MDVLVEASPAVIFINNFSPLVVGGYSRQVLTSPAKIVIGSNEVSIYHEIHTVVPVVPAPVAINIPGVGVEVYSLRRNIVSKRYQHSAWQARLGNKLDPIKRKILDNQILLTSHPTDMLRVRVTRDERSHDIISRTIISSEVLPIMLPTMKDIPLRRLQHQDGHTILSMSLLEDDRAFEAYCPLQVGLERDDLLFRIVKDPYSDSPYFMVLQVKDELGTMSYSSLLYVKYKLSFYDEPLPETVVTKLKEFALKREELTW